MCIHNRANENKEGFWIFSTGDGLGESWHYAYNERNAQKELPQMDESRNQTEL